MREGRREGEKGEKRAGEKMRRTGPRPGRRKERGLGSGPAPESLYVFLIF